MARIEKVSCPNCGADLLLKRAKKDGIQCKSCYYWVPRKELDTLISKEEIKTAATTSVTVKSRTIKCPKCGAEVSFNRVVDGGVMCKNCYNWIPVKEEYVTPEPAPKVEYAPSYTPHKPPSEEMESIEEMLKSSNIPSIPIVGRDLANIPGIKKESKPLPWNRDEGSGVTASKPPSHEIKPKSKVHDPFRKEKEKRKQTNSIFKPKVSEAKGVSPQTVAKDKEKHKAIKPPSHLGTPVKKPTTFRPLKRRGLGERKM